MIEEKITRKITWAEVDSLCEKIKLEVQELNKPLDNIYPVQRGGFIPATILSHKLGLPISTDMKDVGPYSLIVDDISDTGTTLKKFKGLHIVCLHSRKGTLVKPLVSGETLEDKTWIIYPWENLDAKKEQDYKKFLK